MKRFGANLRPAWAIALISVALYAGIASMSIGTLRAETADEPGDPVQEDELFDNLGDGQESIPSEDTTLGNLPFMPSFPTLPPLPTPAPHPSHADPAVGEATFYLSGNPDPQTEEAIEQLIAGRSFSARLIVRQDNAASLTITVLPQPAGSFVGRQSVTLIASAGSTSEGTARNVSIRIVTENGVTHVNIGTGK